MVADGQLILYTQEFPNLQHDLSCKVGASVRVDSQWQSEPGEDVVHQEVCRGLSSVIGCLKTLYPLGELAHDYKEIIVSPHQPRNVTHLHCCGAL